jgi:hypothetical protein
MSESAFKYVGVSGRERGNPKWNCEGDSPIVVMNQQMCKGTDLPLCKMLSSLLRTNLPMAFLFI